MNIKVPVKFLDGDALEQAIHAEITRKVESEIPVPRGGNPDDVNEDRAELYEELYTKAHVLVDLLKERSWAILNLDCSGMVKQATMVRVVK